ncbi:hypothetical protein FRC03_009521, partial [Tulasnella sp. 419]
MPPYKPLTIKELADTATVNSWDPNRSLKTQLIIATNLRKDGLQMLNDGELDGAFVHLARAGTLILEKIPSHQGYHQLTASQKAALAEKGHEVLRYLEVIKPKIQDRYDKWKKSGGEQAYQRELAAEADREEQAKEQEEQERERRHNRRAQEDSQNRRREEDYHRRKDAEDRERAYRRRQDDTRDRYPRDDQDRYGRDRQRDDEEADRNAKEQARALKQRQMEEYERAKRRRDDDIKAERRRKEADMHAAVAAAAGYDYEPTLRTDIPSTSRSRGGDNEEPPWSAGSASSSSHASLNYPPTDFSRAPSSAPSTIRYVTPTKRHDLDFESGSLGPLPLESPDHAQFRQPLEAQDSDFTRRVTGNSPFSGNQPIEYPQLMNPHQRQQGYTPSTNSIFSYSPPSLGSGGPATSVSSLYGQRPRPGRFDQSQYNPMPLPPQIISYPQPSGYPHPLSHHAHQHVPIMPRPQFGSFSSAGPSTSNNAPPRPPKGPIPVDESGNTSDSSATSSNSAKSGAESQATSPMGLRNVFLPKETLSRFLKIAAVNTAMKKETCGLLLGRLHMGVFTVSTLLIPRQTATTDTCTMVEEEMVLEFQEKRDLLTLGWIHTHPTQS